MAHQAKNPGWQSLHFLGVPFKTPQNHDLWLSFPAGMVHKGCWLASASELKNISNVDMINLEVSVTPRVTGYPRYIP